MKAVPSLIRSMFCSRLAIVASVAAGCLAFAGYLAGTGHWLSAAVLALIGFVWASLFVECHRQDHGKRPG